MSETQEALKHTPGPWHLEPFNNDYFPAVSIGGKSFDSWNQIVINSCEPAAEMEGHWANARLIAAAPELLEALNECDKAFALWQIGQIPGRPEDILALIRKTRAAISKATGKPQ